ncbi:hypothetical protein [Deinococcus sp. 6GRE01]|uniref:hypothetical protein n=1 Tax=Deinococcus sp. 6GRE01 TaxID=2745873 RepID=UPI001E52BA4C|nr:hypothetical protein [Deinococcus sp. 6GRE01]MCD0156017.1 hypothetical protein [Deinococcus sp. 6GRE01]
MTAPTPDRTYNPELLTALNVRNLEFARTFARTLLRDYPEVQSGGVPLGPGQPTRPREATWPEFSRTDFQYGVALELDAVLDTTPDTPVKYYRPHITAARLYLGDPSIWKSRAVDGSSQSRRDSQEIIAAWLAQGAALDALIPTGVTLPPFEQPDAVAPSTSTRPRTTVVRTSGGW